MIVEMGKEYRLANGAEYRLFCMDAGGDFPVLGARFVEDKNLWLQVSHQIDGKFERTQGDNAFDLVEVKPRIKGEFWVIHYGDKSGLMYNNKPEKPVVGAIAITHHTYDCEEGEGLK